MRNTTRKFRTIFPLTVVIFLSFWLLGKRVASAPQEDQTKWTAQSHDRTNFPLTGKHQMVSCRECHFKGVFEGTPRTCEACHWERRQDDRYRLQLGIHCSDCHTPTAWKDVKPAQWNHEAVTGFRLEGSHRVLDCAECHGVNGFRKTAVECYSCHAEDYKSTRDPNHAAANFPTQCQVCHHSGVTWKGAKFDHKFPLKGRHRLTACADCHKSGQYTGTPSACVSCHLKDYNGTTDPNHKNAGFPTDCVACHGDGANSWGGAAVDHTQFWPLQGVHQRLDCNACHSKGYNLPKDCYGCHVADYNNTTDPNHKTTGFPTSCDNCHYPTHTVWSQAVFNHDFPIKSGRHTGFKCSDCHLTSNYNQFSCIDCHTHSRSTTDSHHSDVGGYSYSSQACYSCHPKGQAGD